MAVMPLTPATERALEACYGALVDSSRWEDALNLLAHSVGAGACQILPHDYSDCSFGIVRSSGMWPWDESWHRNADWVVDIYAPRGLPLARNGCRAMIQADIFTDDELRASRFHNVVAQPVGCFHWACCSFHVEDRVWCLPFFRNSSPFSSKDREYLAEIADHLERIVSLAEKFARVGAENQILGLEGVGCAAMLVDWSGRIVRLNCLAEALMGAEFGVRNGRLWTADPASAGRLGKFMACLSRRDRIALSSPSPIIISRGGLPWLMMEAMPVADAAQNTFQNCSAVVVVSDLTRACLADTAKLSLIFGLTSSEARLVAMLLSGNDLHSAARHIGTSYETVRSQLKAVFSKTGTHCQSQLLARTAAVKNLTQH